MADEFFEAWETVANEQSSYTAQMEKAIIAHIKVITKDSDASAVFFNEWRHLSEPHLSEFISMKEDYEGRFKNILLSGKAQGEFQQVDEKFMMLTILSSLNWTHNWYQLKGAYSPEEVGKRLANLILNGLKKN